MGSEKLRAEFAEPESPLVWPWIVGGVYINQFDVFAAVTCGALVAALALFFQYTAIGRALRAVADDHQAAMSIGSDNPGWPLAGANLIYDVHMYLDANSGGFAFDFDTELGKNFAAGLEDKSIDLDTGVKRLRKATQWAKTKGVKLAVTEVGMPLDDPRWQTMFERTVAHARADGDPGGQDAEKP